MDDADWEIMVDVNYVSKLKLIKIILITFPFPGFFLFFNLSIKTCLKKKNADSFRVEIDFRECPRLQKLEQSISFPADRKVSFTRRSWDCTLWGDTRVATAGLSWTCRPWLASRASPSRQFTVERSTPSLVSLSRWRWKNESTNSTTQPRYERKKNVKCNVSMLVSGNVALSRENRHPYVDDMPRTNDHRYGRQIHVQQGARYGSPRRRNGGCGNGQHAETTVSIKILSNLSKWMLQRV